MVYTAHIHMQDPQPYVTIVDDRKIPAVQMTLSEQATTLAEIEGELGENGWTVTAAWTTTRDGWQAPVVTDRADATEG